MQKLMDERLLTQGDLAGQIGVHEQTVSRWVLGKSTPRRRHLRQVCVALEVEPDALLEPRSAG